MDKDSSDSNLLLWVMVLVITGFMFGCGVDLDTAAQALQAYAGM